jgi:ligand-binding SRPBCC domain-containing protein
MSPPLLEREAETVLTTNHDSKSSAGTHVHVCSQWVRVDIERAFAFFSDARNLEAITPDFLKFRIVTPLPIEMREGTLIQYRLRFFGAPVDWLTRIDEWRPGHGFTDVQLRGPYALWVHRHRFTSRDGGTLVEDRVEYRLPLAAASAPVHTLLVRPAIERIFAHRRQAIAGLLA